MRLAASTLLYSRYPLTDACERLAGHGFESVDLACHEGWAHVAPSSAANDSAETTKTLYAAYADRGLTPVALNVGCGDVPISTEVERVAALAEIADALDIPVMTLPAAPDHTELTADIDRFRSLVDATRDRDVTLTVETHWGTLTADPKNAAQYAESISELGYTLDPGHYAANDSLPEDAWVPLLPAVEHVHLRQAGSGWAAIQRPPDDGHLDIAAFITTLRDTGYDDAVTVEYIDSLDGVKAVDAERSALELADRLRVLL